ncbi:tRNA modification GTPase GTPBP3, mitochondrial [Strongylocentrotus purpuratus]|uniref:TrmE-type G domain-containing protein n=1 Tax=Strongylocentrotus purpuratus TaxID=7668 RepID=A0A7M7HLU5_STRPU|nr:tRNA modification GTPase GTPBP3, mitochondrial [Strongylocentrotus purpuratus]
MPHGIERIAAGILCPASRLRYLEVPAVAASVARFCRSSRSSSQPCQHSCLFKRNSSSPGHRIPHKLRNIRADNIQFKDNKYKCYSSSSPSAENQRTIFALASGHGKCGVAVVRVSGPQAKVVFDKMIPSKRAIGTRQAVLSPIYDPTTNELIDHGLILWFTGPKSFTGEDVCELQVHGGPAVIAALYGALGKLDGFHLAEPGEFSKRAFYNGKLDLTEVEGLGDLIQAETEAQRQQAVRQMSGVLSKLYEGWRGRLIRTVAHVEAFIDFSEDENIEEGVLEEARQEVEQLLTEVRRHLQDSRKGERLRSGVHVTIAGQPNVGKSTLLNALCQRPAAIVSPIAGTTRDVVESSLNIGGYPVILSDTAGIRESLDEIEREGVRRARERTNLADLVIYMLDATTLDPQPSPKAFLEQIDSYVTQSKLWENRTPRLCDENTPVNNENSPVSNENSPVSNDNDGDQRDVIVMVNKMDLVDGESKTMLLSVMPDVLMRRGNGERERQSVLPVSCKTEEGMDGFLDLLQEKLKKMCSNPTSSDPYLTQERHRNHLTECALSLQSFESRDDLVMAAEELRIALRQLGKITGHVTTEEVLDVIFKDFCIGK